MRTTLRAATPLLLAALAATTLAGQLPADAADDHGIDETPFRAALQKHFDAKLRGHLVDADLERGLLIGELADKGLDAQAVRDLLASHDAAQGRDAAYEKVVGFGVDKQAVDRLLAGGLTPEQADGIRTPILGEGIEKEWLDDLEAKDAAARREAGLRQQLLAKGVTKEQIAALIEPPLPMRLVLDKFEDVTPKGTKATAKAHVAMDGSDKVAVWDVAFELEQTREGSARGEWKVASITFQPPEFGNLNYAVVVVYLIAMLAIGAWTSRRIKGTRGFFIADGRLNYFVVGVSILTAYLSALTMMALPGVAFGKLDWLYGAQLPFLVITAFVITRFVLKRYRNAGVISVYEFLEQRIHISSRLLASACFILFAIGRMGLVLYLPAQAFSIVTGADLVTTIVVMGAVVTVYTVMGGIEAVIWTDFAQAFVMVAGAVLSVVYVLVGTSGQFGDIAAAHHKFRMFASGADITKLLTLWLVLETIFQTIRIYGTQQDITQRYMTTPSTKAANRSVWIAIVGFIPLGFLFLFIGSALFVYYKVNPDPTVAGLIAKSRADSIYPYFVASTLPPVAAGLVIAAIFAAAMSSIDACMNANSTVCVEDFYRRFMGKDKEDRHHLKVARWLTLVWGTLATIMAIQFINIQTAQIVWGKIMGISTNGVLGLMALAFLRRRIHRTAAVAGFLVSYVCLFAMMWCIQIEPTFAFVLGMPKGASGISFLLWPVIGNLVCFGVGLLVSMALGGGREPEPEG